MSTNKEEIDPEDIRIRIRQGLKEKSACLSSTSEQRSAPPRLDYAVDLIQRELAREERAGHQATVQTVAPAEIETGSGSSWPDQEMPYQIFARKLKKYEHTAIYRRLWPAIRTVKNLLPLSWRQPVGIHLNDLLQYRHLPFLTKVYRELLGRNLDPLGIETYLPPLEQQIMHRTEVIGLIRYSNEGRRNHVHVAGLRWKYLGHRMLGVASRLPLVGYPVRWLTAFLLLPRFLRHLRVDSGTMRRDILQLQDELRQNRATHDQLRNEFTRHLAQSANREALLDQLRDGFSTLEASLRKIRQRVPDDEGKYDAFYLDFSNSFRGAREEIKQKLQPYISVLSSCAGPANSAPVVDLGCGRGEWLELLGDLKIPALGVDVNKAAVDYCVQQGLRAEQRDGLDFLQGMRPESLAAVTAFHLIEHLTFPLLLKLFQECLRTLKSGGVVIFETPNPENLIVGTCNFHFDPTHQFPLPPPLMEFTAKHVGFSRVEILRLNPYRYFSPSFIINETNLEIADLFTKAQDYAVIAWK
jgi:SAM-dependent methyltransferase